MDLLGLRAPQLVLRRLSVPPRKRVLAASADQGRNREDPRNKWFRQLVGMSPKPPPRAWEPWAMAPWSLPGASSWRRLPFGKTPSRQVSRELSLTLYQNLLAKVGPGARSSNPIKRQGQWKGKLAFFQMYATKGRADSCPKANSSSSHWQAVSKSF